MTATPSGTEPASYRLELLLDRRAALGHLVVGQGAVGGAEFEAQRERLVALAHLLAAVEVEHVERGKQLPRSRAYDLGEPGRRNLLGNDHGDVLQHRGEARNVAVGRDAPLGELVDQIDVQLERR